MRSAFVMNGLWNMLQGKAEEDLVAPLVARADLVPRLLGMLRQLDRLLQRWSEHAWIRLMAHNSRSAAARLLPTSAACFASL